MPATFCAKPDALGLVQLGQAAKHPFVLMTDKLREAYDAPDGTACVEIANTTTKQADALDAMTHWGWAEIAEEEGFYVIYITNAGRGMVEKNDPVVSARRKAA